ncbi:hypothetical protein EX895_003706 [Sporisorium graminicola]|uniref:Uncharacterized protein n=1 Tax=Sporisorium graminicola TaxID=280036 RepID=A0A4V6ETK8_9BASI|nr:hypothetical protein EX895_003706 [Sporisorium graminicola]TKY87029.1 hypothetical protein EX895_003706 [Sporisorium graminicola]
MKLNVSFVVLALAASAVTIATPLPKPGWGSISRQLGEVFTGPTGSASREAGEGAASHGSAAGNPGNHQGAYNYGGGYDQGDSYAAHSAPQPGYSGGGAGYAAAPPAPQSGQGEFHAVPAPARGGGDYAAHSAQHAGYGETWSAPAPPQQYVPFQHTNSPDHGTSFSAEYDYFNARRNPEPKQESAGHGSMFNSEYYPYNNGGEKHSSYPSDYRWGNFIAAPAGPLTPGEAQKLEEILRAFSLSSDAGTAHAAEGQSSNFVSGTHGAHLNPAGSTYEHAAPASDTHRSDSQAERTRSSAVAEKKTESPIQRLRRVATIRRKNRVQWDNVITLAVEQHKKDLLAKGETSALTTTDIQAVIRKLGGVNKD